MGIPSPDKNDFGELQLASVSFVSRQQIPIRQLPGYSKAHHRIPTESDPKSQSFVGRLGKRIIADDLEQTFQRCRSAFSFKRRDITSTESEEGFGTITTPAFLYSSSVTQCDEFPAEAIWQRDLSQIQHPQLLLESNTTTAFAQIFDTVEFVPPGMIDLEKFIDHIEDLDSPNIQADYDRHVTFCDVALADVDSQIRVTRDALLIKHSQPTSLPILLDAVQRVQTNLIRFADLT